MAKKDYREKIEEDRQQIEVESELSRLSRSKHKAKKGKSPLISILLVTFILIPLSVLFYVKFLYEPTPPKAQQVAVDHEKVEMETNEAAKKQEEKQEQQEADKEAEQAKLEAEKKAAEEEAKKAAQLEAAKKAEQEAAAKKAAEQKAAEEAAKKQQQASAKSHTVQPGDNLYRIAMKYYGDPGAVEKIRAANGLTSDSIETGRTLVLP